MTQIPLSSRFRQIATRRRRSGDYISGRYFIATFFAVSLLTVADSVDYSVTVNATQSTINSGIGATATSILTALRAQVILDGEPVTVGPVDTVLDTFTISSDTLGTAITVVPSGAVIRTDVEQGDGTDSQFFCNIQPPTASKGHDFLKDLPENQRTREVVVVYCPPQTLRTANEGSNIMADHIVFMGRTYEAQRVNYWSGQILTHDQVYCTRLDND